jgi:hypothetical protein
MWCRICDYQEHDGCCEDCIGHTTDRCCVTPDLLGDEPEELLA